MSRAGAVAQVLRLAPQWLARYDAFVARNAGQVSQLEGALRSLTYMIPGRFRDAELASESIHSAVGLLSLYHDSLLAGGKDGGGRGSAHARYTGFWARRSGVYRGTAVALQVVVYTQLLCEMATRRRGGGEGARWRVVVLLEAVKAACRLVLLRATGGRTVVTPALPEREAGRAGGDEDEDGDETGAETGAEGGDGGDGRPPHGRALAMPRTGTMLPPLPDADDISAYLLGRVLTADDVKPAAKLLNRLRAGGQAAEVLHAVVPVVYAAALALSRRRGGEGGAKDGAGAASWTAWLLGVGVECAARQLRERGLRTTALERDEWKRRAWAMGWWAMRGALYGGVTRGVVDAVAGRMPGLVAGILDDYEYLWDNYYFSTSA